MELYFECRINKNTHSFRMFFGDFAHAFTITSSPYKIHNIYIHIVSCRSVKERRSLVGKHVLFFIFKNFPIYKFVRNISKMYKQFTRFLL